MLNIRKWILFAVSFILMSMWQGNVYGQTLPDEVSISYASLNKPLSLVLKEISQKSGIAINFSENRIPANKKISISVTNESVGDILTVILRDIGYGYDIIGNQLVLVKDISRSQKLSFTISGYVDDAVSGEPLIYANVYLYDKTKGTQTNEDGFFSITLPRGTQRLYYSYIGYQQVVREYYLEEDLQIDIALQPDVQLNEVVILEEVENREEETTSSEDNLYLNQIQSASTLGGESDIIRLINMMPGVSGGADGVGGLNIRGGSADQNLILLDGAPVYNPGHALGLFSVFNSDVIKNAKLYKGNIPARFGGRLSSILDVHTRVGNTKKTTGAVSVSTLALKGFVEGPLGKNGSSYLLSGRRTFIDPWIKAVTEFKNDKPGQSGFSTYYFADVNAKINLKLNNKNTIQISAFAARDDFGSQFSEFSINETPTISDKSGIAWNWGNNLISIRYKSQVSKKAFTTLSAYYTDFNFESFDYTSFGEFSQVDTSFQYQASLFESSIKDYNISYGIDYSANTAHRIRAGVGVTLHDFSPGLTNVGTDSQLFQPQEVPNPERVRGINGRPALSGTEFTGYIEDDISFSYGTRLNVGLHSNFIQTESKNYLSLQPRVALLTQADNIYFKIGASRMNQYLHLLTNNGLGLPTDVWLPSTDNLAPEQSWIFSADIGSKNKAGYQWGIETYYKILDDITSFSEGVTNEISIAENWEQTIPFGQGNSYGAEFYFNKIIGRTTWNANYTLSFADQEFPDLNLGNEFPFRYDRRHNAKLGFFHKITDNTEFLLNMTYATGNPITFPTNIVTGGNGEIIPIYTEKNNVRLIPYYRLDFAFNFYSKLNWARQKFSIGLYNAFDRRNEFYLDVVRNPLGLGYNEESYSTISIFPSISYSLFFD